MPESTEFESGDIAKLPNGTETFRVVRVHDDGSVTCWGGSKDPNAYRSFRTFTDGALIPETRKSVIRAWSAI